MNFDSMLLRLRRYAIAAWRRRVLAVFVAWIVCTAGWAGVAALPDKYESTSRIQADADAVLTPMLSKLGASSVAESTVELLQKTLLSSPNLLDIIHGVDQLNMSVRSDAERDALVARLANQIRIAPQRRDLFSITYSNRDAVVAQTVVDAVVRKFEAAATKANMAMMQNSSRFINDEIGKVEGRLQAIEAEMTQFQVDNVDLLPGANGTGSRLDQMRDAVPRLAGDLQDATMRRDLVQRQLASTPEMLSAQQMTFSRNGGSWGLTPLQQARQDLDEARARYSDSNPTVLMMQEKLRVLERAERDAPKSGPQAPGNVPNPLYQHLRESAMEADFQVSSLRRQLDQATQSRDRLEEYAKRVPGLQAKSVQLQRDYAALKAQHESLVKQRETINVSNDAQLTAQQTHIEVIDPPTFPHVPVWPPRRLFVAAVLFLGVMAGGAAAVGRSYLDTSCYTTSDLQRLQFDVLGNFSSSMARKRASLVQNAALGAAFAMLVVACAGLEATTFWIGRI